MQNRGMTLIEIMVQYCVVHNKILGKAMLSVVEVNFGWECCYTYSNKTVTYQYSNQLLSYTGEDNWRDVYLNKGSHTLN